MGSSYFKHTVFILFGVLALSLASTKALAQDKIIRKGGQILEGKIIKGDAESVTYTSGGMTAPILMKDVERIDMASRVNFAEINLNEKLDEAISTLESAIADFKGIPAEWIPEAMALLADAFQVKNETEKANEIYESIRKLYLNYPKFLLKANLSAAKADVRQGKTTEANRLIQPLIEEASGTLTPDTQQSMLYAEAYLIQGMLFEREEKFKEALGAYVKVYSLYPQAIQASKDALTAADRLRKDHPRIFAK
jgi:tetratricopeptide (TPR) repeat protein